MRVFIDKEVPETWKAAQAFSASVLASAQERGLSAAETELIKVRASQMNGCAFCLDLHHREALAAGVTAQALAVLPAWRETDLYGERERAVLAISEAATRMPLTEEAEADLEGARNVLGDAAFAAAQWVAITINAFNRISILSGHPVRRRTADGRIAR